MLNRGVTFPRGLCGMKTHYLEQEYNTKQCTYHAGHRVSHQQNSNALEIVSHNAFYSLQWECYVQVSFAGRQNHKT